MFGYPSIHGKSQKDKGFTAELLRFLLFLQTLYIKRRNDARNASQYGMGKNISRSITALENPSMRNIFFPRKVKSLYWKSPFLSMFRGAPEIDVDIQKSSYVQMFAFSKSPFLRKCMFSFRGA